MEECSVGQTRNLRRKCVRAPRSDGAGFLLFHVYQSRYTHKEQYGSSAVSGHLCTVSYGLSRQCCQPRLREKRKEAPYENTLVSNSPKTQGLLSATKCKAKMKFRVTCHTRSSGSWLAGAISGALGVPQRAARLPGRVGLNDLHVVHGAVLGVCLHHSYSIHHSYALTHSAKNGVFAVKPLGGSEGHKELAAIGVWPCIGHGENSSPWWEKGREESVKNPHSSSQDPLHHPRDEKKPDLAVASLLHHPTQTFPSGQACHLAQRPPTVPPRDLISLVFT